MILKKRIRKFRLTFLLFIVKSRPNIADHSLPFPVLLIEIQISIPVCKHAIDTQDVHETHGWSAKT